MNILNILQFLKEDFIKIFNKYYNKSIYINNYIFMIIII